MQGREELVKRCVVKTPTKNHGIHDSKQFGYHFINSNQFNGVSQHPLGRVLTYDGTFGMNPEFLHSRSQQDLVKQEVGTEAFAVKEEAHHKVEEEKVSIPKKIESQKRKGKRRSSDDDYKPARRRAVQPRKTIQRDSRNNIPNSVHHLLVYVQREFKSGSVTERIFKSTCSNRSYTPTRFYLFQKLLKTRINNYVNEETLKLVLEPGHILSAEFPFKQQSYYCRVARTLVSYFLRTQAVPMVLRSRKVRLDNRMEHLKVQRYLLEDMIAYETGQ